MGFEHTTVTVRGNAPCDNLHPTNCNNGHMSDTVLERIFEKPPFLILPACQHVGYDRIYSSGAVLFLLKQQADFIDNNIFFKTINIKLKKRYKYEMSGNSTILWFYFHFNLLTVASLMWFTRYIQQINTCDVYANLTKYRPMLWEMCPVFPEQQRLKYSFTYASVLCECDQEKWSESVKLQLVHKICGVCVLIWCWLPVDHNSSALAV